MNSETRGSGGIIYGAGVTLGLVVFGMVAVWLFKLIVACSFTPADFGQFNLVETVMQFAAVIFGLGLFGGIVKYVPYYRDKDAGVVVQ